MQTKLSNLWGSLQSSYWFLPTIMALVSFGLSFVMIELDQRLKFKPAKALEWVYQNQPEGAREVLSTIAGSMITVAGVVFSVTIVGFSLASSQFGPHVLRSFMRDRGNQIVLGTFVSTFLYCLMVLRTIRNGDTDSFVPQIALVFSVVLALASLGVLIFFLHHSADSIQGSKIIDRIARDLNRCIEKLFPEKIGQSGDGGGRMEDRIAKLLPRDFDKEKTPIKARTDGFIQAIENETLMETATKHDFMICLAKQPGEFVAEGGVVAQVWPGKRLSDEAESRLCNAFIVGASRTEEQDVGMPIRQLAEIAIRALSPGFNDPYTAMDCIDRLSAGFRKLAGRVVPTPDRYDGNRQLRVIARPTSLPELIDFSFTQIAHSGRTNPAILARLMNALAEIALQARREEDREILRKWALLISRDSKQNLPEESNEKLAVEFQKTMQRLSPNQAE